MDIVEATRSYEAWVARKAALIEADLALKHQSMAQEEFPFLRATFYAWAQRWRETLPELAKTPVVLAVGDLHVENFGTWRDAEGRLVWGVNDYDEAFFMPYANDLVRLATSALLAAKAGHLAVKGAPACDAILAGYEAGLKVGGRPYILAEEHVWLRALACGELRDPVRFWGKLNALATTSEAPPPAISRALAQALPEAGLQVRVVHRIAGLGSLGRQRFVALAPYRGGSIAREAKALVTSGCVWAGGYEGPAGLHYDAIIGAAVRCPDPHLRTRGTWVIRRLSPDCSRIELADLPKQRDELKLLKAMGFETANVHLGSREAVAAVRADLARRPAGWLAAAAKAMVEATTHDWQAWCKAQPTAGKAAAKAPAGPRR